MKPQSHFFSLLLTKANLFNWFLILLFLAIASAGLVLLATDQYRLINPQLTEFNVIIGTSIAMLVTVIFTLLLSHAPITHLQRELAQSEQTYRQSQDALSHLLEEISPVTEGKLSVRATVTEDITGALASTINQLIMQLQQLVSQLHSQVVPLSANAQESQATALHMIDASEHQSQQISSMSAEMMSNSHSMKQVVEQAEQSTESLRQTLSQTIQANVAVKRILSGLTETHQHNQTTSKQLRKLADHAQQLREQLAAIENLSVETTIQSLNATIYANKSGYSDGHGFANVAEAIQHKAQQTQGLTATLTQLTQTMSETLFSLLDLIEQRQSAVVDQMTLSEQAGEALVKIETTSPQLNALFDNITQRAQQQLASSNRSYETLTAIQEIALQTHASAKETAAASGRIIESSQALRQSASGFQSST